MKFQRFAVRSLFAAGFVVFVVVAIPVALVAGVISNARR
jgi:hypothetical protein